MLRPSIRGCFLVASLSLFVACSSETSGDTTSTSSSTGAGGAGCEVGSHPVEGGCEATLAEWTAGPSLIEKRDHNVTVAVESDAGAFLYVLGGVRDMTTVLKSVEFSPIGADGTLGAWASGADLPEAMAGHMVAFVGHTLVVTGGFRAGPSLSKKTEYATVQADGSLGAWSEGPTLAATRFHHAMIAHGDSLYVVGGLTGDNTDSTPLVERAVVASDGSIGAWTEVTPLPMKRSHHGLAADDGALYVSAGLTGDPAGVHTDLSDVLRAPILEDGTLGDWTTVGQLPKKLGTHSSFVHLGYLYVVGGIENNSADTDHVRRAPIGADGVLGAWEDMPPLPKARAHAHQTPVHGGFVYSAGGAVNHASIADVFVGRFE